MQQPWQRGRRHVEHRPRGVVVVAVAEAAVVAVALAVGVAVAVTVVVVAVAVALRHWRSSLPCATMTLAAARTIAPRSGAMKMTRKMNVGPWQQGDNTGRYNYRGDDGPPSSPANGEDNNAAGGEDQGDVTAADVDGGDVVAGSRHIYRRSCGVKHPQTTTMTPTPATLTPKTPLERRPW